MAAKALIVTVTLRESIPFPRSAEPKATGGIFENRHDRTGGQAVVLGIVGRRKLSGQVGDPRDSGVAKQPIACANPPASFFIVSHALRAGAPVQQPRTRWQVHPRCPESVAVELIDVKIRAALPRDHAQLARGILEHEIDLSTAYPVVCRIREKGIPHELRGATPICADPEVPCGVL